MALLQFLSAPNPLPDPPAQASAAEGDDGAGGSGGTSSNIGFVSVSSLTFPVLGLVGFGLIKVLDVVVPAFAKTINSELVAAGVIFLVVVIGEYAFNPDGNNTWLKRIVTFLVGALNAVLLLGVYLGIIELTDLVTT